MDKNNALFKNGEKIVEDHTLVALTIMIAQSNPKEKEMMISVIMNCIKEYDTDKKENFVDGI